jgi:hypothetical protein
MKRLFANGALERSPASLSLVTPAGMLAERHRAMAAPGSAKK